MSFPCKSTAKIAEVFGLLDNRDYVPAVNIINNNNNKFITC